LFRLTHERKLFYGLLPRIDGRFVRTELLFSPQLSTL